MRCRRAAGRKRSGEVAREGGKEPARESSSLLGRETDLRWYRELRRELTGPGEEEVLWGKAGSEDIPRRADMATTQHQFEYMLWNNEADLHV